MQRKPMLRDENPHRDKDSKHKDQAGAQMQPRRGEKSRGLGSDKLRGAARRRIVDHIGGQIWPGHRDR